MNLFGRLRLRAAALAACAALAGGLALGVDDASAHRPVCNVYSFQGMINCHYDIHDSHVDAVCTTAGTSWKWQLQNEAFANYIVVLGTISSCYLQFTDTNPWTAAGVKSQIDNLNSNSSNLGIYTVGHH